MLKKKKNDSKNKCRLYKNNGILPLNNYNNINFYPINFGFNNYYTEYCGSNYAHNNMPPFLTAYCWRRKS
jgi:hypothetical protein